MRKSRELPAGLPSRAQGGEWMRGLTMADHVANEGIPVVPKPLDEPRVAVVVPAYNAEGTISRAIDSVLNQTYKNVEVVVVDDGSTDATAQVVCERCGPVILKRQSNAGAAAARNLGVSACSATIIAFLDADDEWLPDRLAKTVAPMAADPSIGLCYCSAVSVTGSGPAKLHNSSPLLARFPGAIAPPPFLCTPTATVRRECFDACGGFDESLRIWEDRDLFVRLAERFKVHHVDEPLVLIHPRDDSLRRQVDVDDIVAAMYRVTFKALARRGPDCDPRRPLAAMHYAAGRKYLMAGRRVAGLRSLLASAALCPSLAALGWLLLGALPGPLARRGLGGLGFRRRSQGLSGPAQVRQ